MESEFFFLEKKEEKYSKMSPVCFSFSMLVDKSQKKKTAFKTVTPLVDEFLIKKIYTYMKKINKSINKSVNK